MTADVIVIGAGIAGLRAAEVLQAAGKTVIVLEARNRVGGRMVTDRSWGAAVEMGAGWIQGVTNNPIALRAAALGIATLAVDYSEALFDADGTQRLDSDVDTIDTQVTQLTAQGRQSTPATDEPLRAALDRAIAAAALTAAQDLDVEMGITSGIEQEYAADTTQLSALHFDDGDDEQGGDAVVPGGYDQIPIAIAKALDVRVQQVVTIVDTTGKGAVVTTSAGVFTGAQVLVTIPLGVLKAGTITFNPPLSAAKVTAMGRLGMGLLSRTHLKFPSVFWSSAVDADDLVDRVPTSTQRSEWVESLNLHKFGGIPALCWFNAGAFGTSLDAMTDSDAIASASAALSVMFGASYQAPTSWLRSNWSNDPYALGAYSHIGVGGSNADRGTLAAPEGNRFWAGEATNQAYAATTNGAYTSGEDAANAIVAL